MAAAELTRQMTERERIERWRAEELERAGFEPAAASLLAGRTWICITPRTCCATAALLSWPSKSSSSSLSPSLRQNALP
jgi:hypothetical protein